jgi:hypothetical protein
LGINSFRLRKEHRRLQGFIRGKRCGVTENIGEAARKRWESAFLDHSAQRGVPIDSNRQYYPHPRHPANERERGFSV